MEGLRFLKFWRINAAAGTRVISHGGDLRSAASGTDDDEEITHADDSFFDLVIRSPDGEGLKKDFRFSESPRDVFLSKDDVSNSKPLSPATLLRSAPKFKVFMLGFRKSPKCVKTVTSNGESKGNPLDDFSKSTKKIDESSRFSVECRVEEIAVSSTFARDNSLRNKLLKETSDYESSPEKSSRDTVPKYLKLIRPLYLKVSKRQSEKAKLTASFTPTSSPVAVPVNMSPRKLSASSRGGNFKVIAKHLAKSRSASATVGIAPPPPSQRRDDSLLEQHDGIQGAILYCKRSYNSSSEEFSQLFRSSSDPSHQKQVHPSRNSCELQTRCSI